MVRRRAPTPPSSALPVLHARWIAAVIPEPLPAETHATCASCAMCTDDDAAESFNPRTKCCTYLPALPNFLVGAVLGDADPAQAAGVASVAARIQAGVAVTPLGLGVPPGRALLYSHASRAFGHALAMRCPHYLEDGRCGIWRHRNAVCATWFCKHDRGETGWQFWNAVRELLSVIEAQLARACLVALDLDAAAIERTLPGPEWPGMDRYPVDASELDGAPDPARTDLAWGAWAHRKEEFYRACADYVRDLTLDEILGLCGKEVALRIKVLRAAWERLQSPALPARPRLTSLQVLGCGADTCRLSTYSPLDPLEVPRALFDALHHFDGRPEADARAAIAAHGGPELTPGVIRKLADFGVLRESDDVRGER